MGCKRLTYQTADGKRHWVKIHLMALPEGAEWIPADDPSASRTDWGNLSLSAKNEPSGEILARARGRLPIPSDSADRSPRNTSRPQRAAPEKSA